MSKKLFVCSECGYVFPSELIGFIDKKIQVYCEKCGTPFKQEGVEFKQKTYQSKSKSPIRASSVKISEKQLDSLEKAIQWLNKWSYVPIIIVSIISLLLLTELVMFPINWFPLLMSRLLFSTTGILIVIYDMKYISPKILEKKYDEIVVNAFCWGILGSILFGTGAILLLKGIFILFYVIIDSTDKKIKSYNFGLLLKNSLNQFSALAGFIIILLAFWSMSIGEIIIGPNFVPNTGDIPAQIPLIPYIVFISLALIALLIDLKKREDLRIKKEFGLEDFIPVLIFGVLAALFFAAGVFIILKSSIIFLMMFGKTPPIEEKTPEPIPVEKEESEEIRISPYKIRPEAKIEIKEPKIEIKEDATPKELRKEIELKIHESLLPIKDEKDKELVKEYFIKIFAVLSKDLRKQIMDLKIPKKDKNEFLKELAFLTAEEQIKYIDTIIQLSQEIPIKLIDRIRKLPNVKPEHYKKLIEQLKYMDYDEQVKFIEFLEMNA